MATHATLKFDLTIHDAPAVMDAAKAKAAADGDDAPTTLADAVMLLIEWPAFAEGEITYGEAVDFEDDDSTEERGPDPDRERFYTP